MNAIDYYKAVLLQNYANFDGRARRSEYWYFFLINIVASIILTTIDSIIGIALFGTIYSFAVIIPGIAVAVRRLHDVDKSGWMLLIAFIPLIGGVWLIILLATDSTPGDNEYGPNPKENSDELNEFLNK